MTILFITGWVLNPMDTLEAALPIMLACYGLPAVAGHSLWGKTPGKALLGIRVVTDTGGNPGPGRALWRWAVEAVPVVVLGTAALVVVFFVLLTSAFGDGEGAGPLAALFFGAVAVAIAFPFANLVSLVITAHYRSLPDYAARTWVVRDVREIDRDRQSSGGVWQR